MLTPGDTRALAITTLTLSLDFSPLAQTLHRMSQGIVGVECLRCVCRSFVAFVLQRYVIPAFTLIYKAVSLHVYRSVRFVDRFFLSNYRNGCLTSRHVLPQPPDTKRYQDGHRPFLETFVNE